MFEKEKLELIKYFTKKSFANGYHIIDNPNRSNIIFYDLGNVSFIIKPPTYDYSLNEEETKSYFNNVSFTRIMFISDYINKEFLNCRELTKQDEVIFNEFHEGCSKEDKDQGQVSLDDFLVYGLFDNEKLVAVASLWDWGEVLCDIGILVHPDYRRKGYAKEVCLALMNNTERLFIWRCDENNISSYKLAQKIGFIEAGKIKALEIK